MSALRSSGLFMNPNEPTASKIKGQEPFPAPTLFGVRIHPASIREWCGRHVLPGVLAERSSRLHRGRYIRALRPPRCADRSSCAVPGARRVPGPRNSCGVKRCRSEEHTSELQSLMRISYAVFCLKTKTQTTSYHAPVHKNNEE